MALRDQGWLVVDEAELDALFLPGPCDLLAAAADLLAEGGRLRAAEATAGPGGRVESASTGGMPACWRRCPAAAAARLPAGRRSLRPIPRPRPWPRWRAAAGGPRPGAGPGPCRGPAPPRGAAVPLGRPDPGRTAPRTAVAGLVGHPAHRPGPRRSGPRPAAGAADARPRAARPSGSPAASTSASAARMPASTTASCRGSPTRRWCSTRTTRPWAAPEARPRARHRPCGGTGRGLALPGPGRDPPPAVRPPTIRTVRGAPTWNSRSSPTASRSSRGSAGSAARSARRLLHEAGYNVFKLPSDADLRRPADRQRHQRHERPAVGRPDDRRRGLRLQQLASRASRHHPRSSSATST